MGLVGANGSGKTTLVNVLCGNIEPVAGEFWFEDTLVHFESAADALSRGIRMLPQTLEIYPSLNVLENIFIGQEIGRGVSMVPMMAWRTMDALAVRLLDRVGASGVAPMGSIEALSGGQKKAVALSRLLAREAAMLVFDEPMAALGLHQKERLLEIFKAEAGRGCGIVFISHDIDDVLRICDRVVVLADGVVVKDVPRDQTDKAAITAEMVRGQTP